VTGLSPDAPQINIRHGEFSQSPAGWDRNFDENALEFVDAARTPVFQLIFRGQSDIYIPGIFASGKTKILANENGFIADPSLEHARSFRPALPLPVN
jgi:hypothetical protein